MSKIDNVKIKYSSPGKPSFNIDINEVYTYKKVKDTYKISDNLIKQLFTPVGSKWEDINKAEIVKESKDKKVADKKPSDKKDNTPEINITIPNKVQGR